MPIETYTGDLSEPAVARRELICPLMGHLQVYCLAERCARYVRGQCADTLAAESLAVLAEEARGRMERQEIEAYHQDMKAERVTKW